MSRGPIESQLASALLRYVECRRRCDKIDSASFMSAGPHGSEIDVSRADVTNAKQDAIDARESIARLIGEIEDVTLAVQILALASMEKL